MARPMESSKIPQRSFRRSIIIFIVLGLRKPSPSYKFGPNTMKIIYSGLEGSGKSLKLARVAQELVWRNHKWQKASGISRSIATNMLFSEKFLLNAKELNVPIINWQNLDDLIKLEQCDVIIDEVGNYFDSRMWADLSLDVRKWLTQGGKCGIEIYGSAQDFAQVDKAFRRLVNALFDIRKLFGSRRPSATKPPVKKIWGLCVARALDPQGYDEDKKAFNGSFIPHPFIITRKDCEVFDTTQKIGRSEYPAMRHEVRYCQLHPHSGGDGSCTFCKTVHI